MVSILRPGKAWAVERISGDARNLAADELRASGEDAIRGKTAGTTASPVGATEPEHGPRAESKEL
jgi:hypothetical protein